MMRVRRRRVSALLAARREAARAHAAAERARRAGLEPEQLRVAMFAAYRAWRLRFPWRFLPESLAGAAFLRLGRRFASRSIASWTRTAEASDG